MVGYLSPRYDERVFDILHTDPSSVLLPVVLLLPDFVPEKLLYVLQIIEHHDAPVPGQSSRLEHPDIFHTVKSELGELLLAFVEDVAGLFIKDPRVPYIDKVLITRDV